jgi:membrane-bound lytic murein transglycosylase A
MRRFAALLLLSVLSACATTPTREGTTQPARPAEAAEFSLRPVDFNDLPGWRDADLAPALLALIRTCDARSSRTPDQAWSSVGRYGGAMVDWAPACAGARSVQPGQERVFFEANFIVNEVRGPGEARLTAYYEPVIEARRTPEGAFTAPLLNKPSDMVSIDLAAFADAYDNEALRGAPRALTGQLSGSQVRPYPQRSQIRPYQGQAFAYANPVDLYNLQVQGSGRLAFPSGEQVRANYAAQNGYRWRSAMGALRDSGQLQGGATWQNFRAWSDANGAAATQNALNADPSYVFFQEEQISDPSAGPRGAAGIPLTPMGSIAVDPDYHPYGAIVFVDGQYDGAPFRRLLVAQDTGGAIRRGPQRGDVFFGSGPQAGQGAERMNAPARWWTLLPRNAPIS